jgi:Cof subfamily protein (haloacid dehalogenase superfamily)
MAIKLVAVDLDDTLLDHSLSVSPRTCEAIRLAEEQGVAVTIATGRMFSSALPYARQLNMKVPLITYNGGMVRYPQSGAMIFHQTIDGKIAGQILELFRGKNWYLQSYVNDLLYVAKRGEKARQYEALAGVEAVPLGEAFYQMRDEPTKMLAMAEPDELQVIQETIHERFPGAVFTATSKPTYLELTHPDVNKGHALAILAAHLGIQQEEVMAIGDSNNDYPMIRYAGFGVAMGNASARVKGIAQAVTTANDAHGVAEALEKHVLR